MLFGRAMVKLDAQGRVIAFGSDVHGAFPADLEPLLSAEQAAAIASEGLANVNTIEQKGRRILPIPLGREMDYRAVHEVLVLNTQYGRPGRYQCFVDARSGELLYRRDLVMTEHHPGGDGNDDDAADVQVNGNVHLDGATVPTEVVGLPDLRVTINGNFLFTDDSGFLPSGITGPVSAQFQLRGRWSNTMTGGTTPSFTTTINEGSNTVSFDAAANVKQRTAYHSVSNIHNHCNAVLPGFTGMDQVLPTYVDVTGDTCNAYYDGASINFYAQSTTCRALSLYADVVYHEYGHGINSTYYQSLGGNFSNGAMNEAYADVWAITLTENPVMTLGYQFGFPNSFIRRYDINPHVYPVDITGEVHRDGEIIAGAWWDTYRLLNWNMPLTLDLFAAAFPGMQAETPSGQEGQAYRDVLLDVLQADDTDGNLTNGTPNGLAIAEAFAIHGITLLSNAQFNHTPVLSALEGNTIPINSTLTLTFPFNTYVESAELHYKVSNSQPWVTVPLNINGSNYTAQIPGQPGGAIVSYYLTLNDIFGTTSSVTPSGAQFYDQGYLPNYILVGFSLMATEDGDDNSQLGNWTTMPQGNATTGQWEYGVLIGSYSTPGDPSTIVQPAQQHTPGGALCWYTGNAPGTTSGIGTNDVDGGSTILQSDPINLTGYTNPAFTYWRWYSNNTGANPSADWWQVQISNNNGSTWVKVEDTKSSDRSWRRKAFRVQEYVAPTANVRLRFIASDSIRPNVQSNGGSLVEGALDDIQLWNGAFNTLSVEERIDPIAMLYPSPADHEVYVLLAPIELRGLRFEVTDMAGRTVVRPASNAAAGQLRTIDVTDLADGHYMLRMLWEGGRTERRFSVMH
ncbi:MAG: T9SS type A sorting domain-containing protein [Flavobacteriales bacterium]|nr:T9SS type A sorting domain-containing protein [Flavobacteriales bacterium]